MPMPPHERDFPIDTTPRRTPIYQDRDPKAYATAVAQRQLAEANAGHAAGSLPTDAAERKSMPLAEGLLWYFPNALAEVARVSKKGNDQHNPGQPMHHARGKSTDHADTIMRHLIDAGKIDSDGMRHTAKVAWRALAMLQEELERDLGLPLPRNARAA